MPIPKTKLRPPTLRQPIVPRPRLTGSFTDRRPLTVVSAPAGSGKTTLALEWLALTDGKVAWLSLDSDDNDPIRFINGVVSALHVAGVKFHAPSGQRNPKTIVTEIINQLADLEVESITLVLDDYHVITEESIHATLAYLLDHIPASLQLVVATREEPPLPIARYRARGQLREFHGSDLRFTIEETKLFLNEVMGLNLSAAQLHSLEEHTQGWIAGLQMAGISLQSNNRSNDFSRSAESATAPVLTDGVRKVATASRNGFIVEYLLTEVFNHQPKEVQGFLLNTSILEKFSPDLCEVIFAGNAKRMLSHVERSNLFITKVDDWFQYHPLFREFLQAQLQNKFPERVPNLHRKACDWLERNGFLAEAISHAFASSDDETAAKLIAALAPDYFKRGELVTLRRWLSRLPESVIWNLPRLCLTQIWLLLDSNRQNEAQTYFDRLGGFLAKNLRGEFLAVRALHAAMTHQPELALKFAQKAQKTPEAKDPFIQTYVSFGLGAAQKMGLHFFQAEQSFREALALAERAENSYIAMASNANLADVLYLQARLSEAEKVCQDALLRYQENTPYASDLYWTLARIARQRNMLDQALTFINLCIDLCVDTEEAGLHVLALVERAQVQYASGDKNLAQSDLDSADPLARGLPEKTYLRSVVRQRVLFAADSGDVTSARGWLKELAEYGDKPFPFYSAFTEGKVLLAEKKYRQANSSFVMTLRYLGEVDYALFRLEVLVWQAVSLEGLGYVADATQALTDAVTLARTGDVIHPFVAAREGLIKLMTYLGRDEYAWVSGQIDRNGTPAKSPARSESDDPDLTRREKEIIGLIEMGMSNREMAEKLVIAEGTLKRHVANLYQKLGVHNRAQAIKQFYRQ